MGFFLIILEEASSIIIIIIIIIINFQFYFGFLAILHGGGGLYARARIR